uniref:Uncharacterized protein n=1 Tax=Geobacter sp. (strain M21) TaxID=443144 RepID=C6E1E9_GEOSM
MEGGYGKRGMITVTKRLSFKGKIIPKQESSMLVVRCRPWLDLKLGSVEKGRMQAPEGGRDYRGDGWTSLLGGFLSRVRAHARFQVN